MKLHKYHILKENILLITILIFISNVTTSGAQKGHKYANKYINNVVQFKDTNKNPIGFGFVVGEKDDNLYVVTARHVFFPEDEPFAEKLQLKAYFNVQVGNDFTVKDLPHYKKDLDLILLEIKKPSETYQWKKEFYNPKLKENQKVWFIGKPSDTEFVDPNPGNIDKYDNTNIEVINLHQITRGCSGAPLINKNGIVGMITDHETPNATAIRIKETVEEWGKHYWGLEEYKWYKNRTYQIGGGGIVSVGLGFVWWYNKCRKRDGDGGFPIPPGRPE